jgi:hypothetical protein
MIAPTVSPPYLYSWCPCCEQRIRFTLRHLPGGQLEYDSAIAMQGLRLHQRYACEAVDR